MLFVRPIRTTRGEKQIETIETAQGNIKKACAKQEIQRVKAVFTLNNYTEKDWETLRDNRDVFKRLVVGKEIGEKKGTPHLQGYCEFKKKERRIAFFKALLGHTRTVFENKKIRGNIWHQNDYCTKQGKDVIKWNIPRPLEKYTREDLQPKHLAICDKFKEYEDAKFGRKIYWFWEGKGNWGKTLCCGFMIDTMKATLLAGKRTDMFCGLVKVIEKELECPPIVLVDIPRSSHGFIDYSGLEKIKDGMFFSPKYESGMVRFNRPHIICFANEPPLYDLMSLDRWVVEELH